MSQWDKSHIFCRSRFGWCDMCCSSTGHSYCSYKDCLTKLSKAFNDKLSTATFTPRGIPLLLEHGHRWMQAYRYGFPKGIAKRANRNMASRKKYKYDHAANMGRFNAKHRCWKCSMLYKWLRYPRNITQNNSWSWPLGCYNSRWFRIIC